ncbi:MAG TPA: hypothetical protein VEO00_11035 [Actinomycetota bacterium]|nr:hypothetical protein [Actinomycetota bacterium]
MATLGGTLYGVAAAPSGKIVVAGSIDMATDRDTFVARRTTTGAANGSASIAI